MENADLMNKLNNLKTEMTELETLIKGPLKETDNNDDGTRSSLRTSRLKIAMLSSQINLTSNEFQGEPEHPLMNDLILTNVARYLDYPSLKISRLVSTKWDETLFPVFEKRSTLHVEFNYIDKPMKELFSTFCSSIGEVGEFHKFRSVQITSAKYLDIPVMKEWMVEYGRNFQRIKLGCDYPTDAAGRESLDNLMHLPSGRRQFEIGTKSLRSIFLEWCPNLKQLIIPIPLPRATDANSTDHVPLIHRLKKPTVHLELLQIGSEKSKYRVGYLLKEVLGAIAGVDTLDLKCAIEGGWTDFISHGILPCWSCSSEPTQAMTAIQNLVHLNLQDCLVSADIFNTLTIIGCTKLKKLQLGVLTSYSKENGLIFNKLLRDLSGQLEMLNLSKLEFAIGVYTVPALPAMSNLKQLIVSLAHWELESLDFISQFPKLEVLSVYGSMDEQFLNSLRPRNGQKSHQHLRCLDLRNSTAESFNRGFLLAQKISSFFPKLQQLTIGVIGLEFKEVLWKLASLKFLKKLEIHVLGNIEDHPDNSTISSLPFPAVQKVTFSNKMSGEHYNLNLRDVIDTYFSAPTLGCFELRRFEIAFDDYILLSRTRKLNFKFINCRLNT